MVHNEQFRGNVIQCIETDVCIDNDDWNLVSNERKPSVEGRSLECFEYFAILAKTFDKSGYVKGEQIILFPLNKSC